MQNIELIPTLDCCIETTAKKKYDELVQALLENKSVNSEIEEKLEALRLFLETTDFKKLRVESEKHLIEGEIVQFTIHLEGVALKCEMHIL